MSNGSKPKKGAGAKAAQARPKAKPRPVVVCVPSQTPKLTTVSGPKDLGCGGFDWKVWFDIPKPAGKDGWVIQEITAVFKVKNADGTPNLEKTYHYWEAWEVKQGKTITTWQDQKLDDNDDQYVTPSRPNTKGTISVRGKAKFYEGPLPPDFKKNNPNTVAGILDSTATKPACWDGSGKVHNINSTWDCTTSPGTSSVSAQAGTTKIKGK